MNDFIIDGSHFIGVLQAIQHLLTSKHKAVDVVLVCDNDTEEYVLKLQDGRDLARFDY